MSTTNKAITTPPFYESMIKAQLMQGRRKRCKRTKWKLKIARLEKGILKIYSQQTDDNYDNSMITVDTAHINVVGRQWQAIIAIVSSVDMMYLKLRPPKSSYDYWMKLLKEHASYRQMTIQERPTGAIMTEFNHLLGQITEMQESAAANLKVRMRKIEWIKRALCKTRKGVESEDKKKEKIQIKSLRETNKPHWRTTLPAFMTKSSIGMSIWDVMKGMYYHGCYEVPLNLFEPLNSLQVLCEHLRHSQLLDQAASPSHVDPLERMTLVCAFILSCYSEKTQRLNKPFEPLLGETFEFDRRHDMGWRFHSEQVEHTPPVAAATAEGTGWDWSYTLAFRKKHLTPTQNTYLIELAGQGNLQLNQYQESYAWSQSNVRVDKILYGPRRISFVGKIDVHCNNGMMARILFDDQGANYITGTIKDTNHMQLATLEGQINDTIQSRNGSVKNIFTAMPASHFKGEYYGFGEFAMSLNELKEKDKNDLPPTDTRFRPDQRMLEYGKLDKADEMKSYLEKQQRQRTNVFTPNWFKPTVAITGPKNFNLHLWTSNNKYWQSRETKFKDTNFPKLWPS